jgi:threonine/homoserine/homoserine lactone efflux protein
MQATLAFLALLLPLTLSPGPATIALAGQGMRTGVAGGLPFLCGLVLACFAITVAGGMGLNEVFRAYPLIHDILRYAGVAYIVYLAAKLMRARPDLAATGGGGYRFHDGLLLSALNPKYYAVVTVVFSQFLDPGQGALWLIILGTTAVVAASMVVWLAIGAGFRPLLKSARALRIQSVTFGVLLLAVALFMLMQGA